MSRVYFNRQVRLGTNRKTRNKMMQNFHHISAFLVYLTFSAKIKSITRCISTLLDAMFNSVGHTITEKSAKNGGHAHRGSTVISYMFVFYHQQHLRMFWGVFLLVLCVCFFFFALPFSFFHNINCGYPL